MKYETITNNELIKAKEMHSQELGKWFESKIKKNLQYLQEYKSTTFMKLQDTGAAGTYLSAVAGDFLAFSKHGSLLIEAKCSVTHDSLKSCLSNNVTKGQALEHILMTRAGQNSVFIFLAVSTGSLQVWDGSVVASHRQKGKQLRKNAGLVRSFEARDIGLVFESLLLGYLAEALTNNREERDKVL